jgi:hypothetical protein
MRKLFSCSALVVTLAALGGVWVAAQQPLPIPNAVPKENVSVLMRAKLGSSQKVVEGLMSGDFKMIGKGALDLERICDSAGWRQHEDSIVTHYRSELKRSAIKLAKLANEENLDGAAYTYMHTLTTCINCHEYARNVLRIASNFNSPVVPIPTTEREQAAYRAREIFR